MFFVNEAFVPTIVVEPRERRRTFGLHNCDLRLTVNQPACDELTKTLSKRGTVPEISAGHNQMIRRAPLELLHQFECNRLLTFNAKWIDRVDEIDRLILSKLANQVHARVEIAVDFQYLRAIIQRLRELRMTHLATGHDDRAQHIGARRIRSQTRRGVSGARADNQSRAELARLRYRRGHAC